MTYNQFKRPMPEPPLAPRPPEDVSPIYFHLYDDVDANPQLTQSLKTIVFCVAYTLYSVKKKDDVLQNVILGKDRRSHEISSSFEKYINTPGLLNVVIREASEIAGEYANELKAFNQRYIVDNIDAINAKQTLITNNLEDVLQRFSHGEKFSLSGFRNHFIYTFFTAVIAALLGYLLANPHAVYQFFFEIFGALSNHFFPSKTVVRNIPERRAFCERGNSHRCALASPATSRRAADRARAHRVKLKNDIARGAVVRWSDVEIDAGSETVKTRRAMEASFGGAGR